MKLALLLFLAQTPSPTLPTPPRPPDQGMNMLIWMGFAFVLIYFLTIRPQQRRQKELAAQIAALKTGDRVITNSGIHGTITNIKDGPTMILRIDESCRITIEKSAVASIVRDKVEKTEKSKS
jgi:preprotein translocase subunit YajC